MTPSGRFEPNARICLSKRQLSGFLAMISLHVVFAKVAGVLRASCAPQDMPGVELPEICSAQLAVAGSSGSSAGAR